MKDKWKLAYEDVIFWGTIYEMFVPGLHMYILNPVLSEYAYYYCI